MNLGVFVSWWQIRGFSDHFSFLRNSVFSSRTVKSAGASNSERAGSLRLMLVRAGADHCRRAPDYANKLGNQSRGLQEEINQEIDRASSKLQVSVDDFRKESWDELIDRYERWKAAAKYPGLIKDVFLARVDANEQARLMQLSQTARRFEHCLAANGNDSTSNRR